mgnify:CR=1 FL=1
MCRSGRSACLTGAEASPVIRATLHPVATSRLLLQAILAVAALLLAYAAMAHHDPEMLGRQNVPVDFHAYYVAGTLGLEGNAADSYAMATNQAAQLRLTGVNSFMPWTYPPPFTLFVTGLAAMPFGLAYALFVGLTLAFYVSTLRKIAGAYLPGVLIAILPNIMLIVMTGQNGFLTGGLVGLFMLAFIQQRASAGIPLGLMIIKPHLAVAISLLSLLGRRWQAMAIAAAIVIVALMAPTIIFGLSIWPAFLNGVRESSEFLEQGYYPLFRMTSVYAMVRSAGLSSDIAFAAQGGVALSMIGLLLYGWWRSLPPHLLAALGCVVSVFISPYNYDYDLCIVGVGIAFILPGLLERTRPVEQLALLALCWLATGYGLFAAFGRAPEVAELGGGPVSLMALPLLLLIGLIALALRRQVREDNAASVSPAPALHPGQAPAV